MAREKGSCFFLEVPSLAGLRTETILFQESVTAGSEFSVVFFLG